MWNTEVLTGKFFLNFEHAKYKEGAVLPSVGQIRSTSISDHPVTESERPQCWPARSWPGVVSNPGYTPNQVGTF